jgi:hypothetical protein
MEVPEWKCPEQAGSAASAQHHRLKHTETPFRACDLEDWKAATTRGITPRGLRVVLGL